MVLRKVGGAPITGKANHKGGRLYPRMEIQDIMVGKGGHKGLRVYRQLGAYRDTELT